MIIPFTFSISVGLRYFKSSIKRSTRTSFTCPRNSFAIASVLGKAFEIYAAEELEDLNEEERQREIQRQKDMDPLYELYKALFIDKDGVSLNLLESSTRNSVLFIKAEDYLEGEINNFHTNGTASLEVGNMITGMHTQSLDSY